MFIGKIDDDKQNNIEYYSIMKDIIHYLKKTDFAKFDDGEYPIGNKGIVAKVQRYITKPVRQCKAETHNKYVDVQFIYKGEENLGWCPLSPELEISQDYDSIKDVTFYKKLVPESYVVLSERSFAVLYPTDVHRPCGALDDNPEEVTKVVVKIPVEILR